MREEKWIKYLVNTFIHVLYIIAAWQAIECQLSKSNWIFFWIGCLYGLGVASIVGKQLLTTPAKGENK